MISKGSVTVFVLHVTVVLQLQYAGSTALSGNGPGLAKEDAQT